jgi:polyphosphate kinase
MGKSRGRCKVSTRIFEFLNRGEEVDLSNTEWVRRNVEKRIDLTVLCRRRCVAGRCSTRFDAMIRDRSSVFACSSRSAVGGRPQEPSPDDFQRQAQGGKARSAGTATRTVPTTTACTSHPHALGLQVRRHLADVGSGEGQAASMRV